ncbi:interferon gamma-related-like [Triplophysa dalaica]|uniref:interferon gamma-related-like n=1 Tax=Triplophysa dalaica TaxID=1582913 RepID=UPI0024DF9F4B|nr:interferon gamma-related-like [Triplophysa dalaica]
MNLSRNVVLMCVFITSLQGSDGSRLPVSKTEKEKTLKQLEEIIHPLQNFYNTTGTEWVGNPVFSPYLDQMNSRASCTCQTMLLDRILKLYEEIFTEMSNNSEKKEVKNNLKNAVKEVEKLRRKFNGEQKLWKDLQDINLIKVKNGTVQKGALNDFLMVFDLAY